MKAGELQRWQSQQPDVGSAVTGGRLPKSFHQQGELLHNQSLKALDLNSPGPCFEPARSISIQGMVPAQLEMAPVQQRQRLSKTPNKGKTFTFTGATIAISRREGSAGISSDMC
jgi:hypothetical protein